MYPRGEGLFYLCQISPIFLGAFGAGTEISLIFLRAFATVPEKKSRLWRVNQNFLRAFGAVMYFVNFSSRLRRGN